MARRKTTLLGQIIFFIPILILSQFSKAPLWKTSTLTALFHGPHFGRNDPIINTMHGIEKAAEGTKVSLASNGDKQRVLTRLEGTE